MNDNHWVTFLIGIVVGVWIMAAFATIIRDRGRDECNINLPRSEECIQVWVPPSKETK